LSLLAFFVTQSLNALSQAALLFFLGVGLTLIFGIMRIVNFAHGTLYMLGAFVGYSVARLTGSFWAALLLAPLAVGLVGMLFEFAILRRLYQREASAFLMVTFGLALVLGEIIRLVWGPEALQVEAPQAFAGIVFLLDEPFPTYRLFLAGAGIIVAVTIWQFLDRTRLGLLIRAASQNPEMVSALGTDVNLLRSAVFGIGCGLAGIGGGAARDRFCGHGRDDDHRCLRDCHHWRNGELSRVADRRAARRVYSGLWRILPARLGARFHVSANAAGPRRATRRASRQGGLSHCGPGTP
jgi:branched-chain amino acid transport system permease protein